MKRILLLFLCIALSFSIVGCYNHYAGDHEDLYTVAINSLLWNLGHSYLTEYACDSEITIIEEDSHGRILFSYTEKYFAGDDIAFSSLLICQKIADDCVYYYPDYNFISVQKDKHSMDPVDFDDDKIENLKEVNDWGQEINLNKCIKKEISNQKKKVPVSEERLEEILSAQYKGYKNHSTFYLTEDDCGRFICYSRVSTVNDEAEAVKSEYVVILFNSDLTYSFYVPTDYYNYQDEFKEFKEQARWNKLPDRKF